MPMKTTSLPKPRQIRVPFFRTRALQATDQTTIQLVRADIPAIGWQMAQRNKHALVVMWASNGRSVGCTVFYGTEESSILQPERSVDAEVLFTARLGDIDQANWHMMPTSETGLIEKTLKEYDLSADADADAASFFITVLAIFGKYCKPL